MKILLVTDFHDIPRFAGGVERFVDELVLKLQQEGHQVLELKTPLLKGYKPFTKIFNRCVFNRSLELITSFNPDIVYIHLFYFGSSIAPFLAAFLKKKPIVLTLHDAMLFCPKIWYINNENKVCDKGFGLHCIFESCYPDKLSEKKQLFVYLDSFWSFFKDLIYRFVVKKTVSIYILPSRALASELVKSLRIEDDKIKVIPNFTKTVFLEQKLVKKKINEFLFVGRIDREKGLDVLIDALFLLVKKRGIKDINLKIVGDGKYTKEMKKRVLELGLVKNVEFKGRIDDDNILNTLYSQALALVVPSLWFEAFGLVAIEAFKNKTCVIASNIGGLKELVEDNNNGFLFNHNDAFDLANKIEFVYKHPEVAIKLGQNAFEQMRNKYSIDKYYRDLMNVFKSLV